MWVLGEATGGQIYFLFNPVRTNCPQLWIVLVYLNMCNIHWSFCLLIELSFNPTIPNSTCIFILCSLIILCSLWVSVLLCILLSITPECIHVLCSGSHGFLHVIDFPKSHLLLIFTLVIFPSVKTAEMLLPLPLTTFSLHFLWFRTCLLL